MATLMDSILPAVDVRSVYKSYTKKVPVLQSTDLLVREGHIYGLLGPSGCGKTTLLRLVVGRLQPDKGRIRVLGHQPGTVESGVPGSKIGYMPQELALYKEFTVAETLYLFGRVHQMTTKAIENRMLFLLNFLDLPPSSRRIDQLSGGQQRRVSLAVALLHSPPILILDEPTVGVDPLLRQKIWDHLVGISKSANTTIIITTHYIEEARSANTVGLMRSGRMLAEGPPNQLLEAFQRNSLEDVFLHLCMRDEESDGHSEKLPVKVHDEAILVTNEYDGAAVSPPAGPSMNNGHVNETDNTRRSHSIVSYDEEDNNCASRMRYCCSGFPKARNILALFIKNLHVMRKRIPFLLFQFILPAIQITLFSLCVGGVPKDLNFVIVNFDVPVNLSDFGLPHVNVSFSEAFISMLDVDVINKKYSDNISEARQTVVNGSAWGYMVFGPDFSSDTYEKLRTPNASLPGATINISMDMTNQQVSMTLNAKILGAFQNLSRGISQQIKAETNLSIPLPDLESFPIKYADPIYGVNDATFLDFMAPGIICSIIYFMATGLTTLAFVSERKEGLFERSLVSGVTIVEIMLGHIVTQFFVMAVQVAVLLSFALGVFQVYFVGSIVIIIIFTLMMGMTGMALGFLLSTAAKDEQAATQMALASVYPSLLISGILWPIEAMPQWLQYISICTPITLAAEGMRFVLGRGWDFTYYEVWRGFLVMTGWAVGFLLLSIISAKVKKLN